jgi:probable phosphoglycerate mutase
MSIGSVYIVRHGNTFDKGDTILRVGGRTDLPLSKSGKLQAERLSNAFKTIVFSMAYSSDLKRTRQTAEAILGEQSYALVDFLTEIDYGPDEGKAEQDVIARLGQEALDKWDREALPPERWHVDVEGLRSAWQAFLATCDPHANTLVVTSNGVARFVLDVVDCDRSVPLKLRTGSYGVVELKQTGPVLSEWDIRPED